MIVDESPRIREAVWEKLLSNLASGPICVLGRGAPEDLYDDPVLERTVRAGYEEGMAVAAAMGCPVKVDIDSQLAHGRAMSHKPSILQDLEQGRPMEIDGIYGAALELARIAGIATPALDLLVALTKVRARAAGLY